MTNARECSDGKAIRLDTSAGVSSEVQCQQFKRSLCNKGGLTLHMRCSLAMGCMTVYIMVATGKEGRKV